MKKIFFALSTLIIMLSFTSSNVLPIGSAMPKADIKLKDVSGIEISLKELKKENGMLIMFSCNTCPYVIKNQQRTIDIAAYAQKNKIGLIILNSNEGLRNNEDSYQAMQQYAKAQQYKWHYAVDKNNEIADAFGATRTPECFLFNADLKLAYHGAIDDNPSDAKAVNRNHLKEAINEMVAGKEISFKETRSVGCGIKRKGK